MTRRRESLGGQLLRGAIAGTAATWLMDVVTTGVENLGPPEDAERERAVQPNGKTSVENLVDRLAGRLNLTLDTRQTAIATNLVHFGLGAGPGAAYVVLRDRMPLLGAGRGLLFGALLWLVNDEYLNAQLGLSAPPGAYPDRTHLRGLIGHLVLGVGTDVAADLLSLAARPRLSVTERSAIP